MGAPAAVAAMTTALGARATETPEAPEVPEARMSFQTPFLEYNPGKRAIDNVADGRGSHAGCLAVWHRQVMRTCLCWFFSGGQVERDRHAVRYGMGGTRRLGDGSALLPSARRARAGREGSFHHGNTAGGTIRGRRARHGRCGPRRAARRRIAPVWGTSGETRKRLPHPAVPTTECGMTYKTKTYLNRRGRDSNPRYTFTAYDGLANRCQKS